MVSGALLHALRIGMDSAYNNDEIDQARDHHDNADTRADKYAIPNALINRLANKLSKALKRNGSTNLGAVFQSRTDYKFT